MKKDLSEGDGKMDVFVVTTPGIPGYSVKEVKGLVYGQSVRTRGALGRIVAGIEALVGGSSQAYLEEFNKARDEAIERLKENAVKMGANAVIGVDFETSEILEGFILITVYGTAVVVEKER
jgi:uncharacterized protein YbjQ (UPF0145 family)